MRRRLLMVVAVAVLTLSFMHICGNIRFDAAGTERLVKVAGWFGVYGDEGIEDFFLATTAIAGLLLALAIVATASALLTRRVR